MYSFESFLYREVNRATRDKDSSKILTLGPFSFLLTKILQRLDPKIQTGKDFIFQTRAPGFVTYRGLSLSLAEVQTYQNMAPRTVCSCLKNAGCRKFKK